MKKFLMGAMLGMLLMLPMIYQKQLQLVEKEEDVQKERKAASVIAVGYHNLLRQRVIVSTFDTTK